MGRRSRGLSQRRHEVGGSGAKRVPTPKETGADQTLSAFLRPDTIAAAVVLLLVLATVWAVPRVAGDTFMGLAGGRDVFDGKLATPDDWSFTTSGRVWLNQNWGFDALAYASMHFAGELGLLLFKAALIAAIAAALVAAGRARGATWPASLLITATALAGARQFMEIRANTASYLMASLLLLIIYQSRSRPRLIWASVPLIAVWANLHGGFMLGLAVLGLWVAASGLAALLNGGVQAALRKSRAPVGALVASVALAAVANPFGIQNVVYPFTFTSDPEWRAITEWHGISFTSGPGVRSAWELVAYLVAIVLTVAWRRVSTRPPDPKQAAVVPDGPELKVMDAGLLVAMAFVGFSTLRFVPFTFVLLAPLAARQASEIFRRSGSWWPATACAALLAAAVLPFAVRVTATYSATNPRFTHETTFQRMTTVDHLPCGAADFLVDNRVGGRVFADWPWEGYLRWRRPELRFFIGGRANGVYSLDTLREYRTFGAVADPAELLDQWGIHLVVVPLEREYLRVVDRLAFGAGTHWALTFYDGRSVVLTDLNDGTTRALANDVKGGVARFRDGRVAALSRALCRVSSGRGVIDAQRLTDLVTATRNFPTAGGPWFLFFAARTSDAQPIWLVRTLENLYDSLTKGDTRSEDRLRCLQARLSAAQILGNLYGRGPQATRWIGDREELLRQLQALLESS